MRTVKFLNVYLNGINVGTLATTPANLVAFEYDEEWIRSGFSINPYSLPLKKQVFVPKNYHTFEGLFGVFSDSLPDGWGRLLLDRVLLKNGIEPSEIDSLTRLAIVGNSGMGALTYEPEWMLPKEACDLTLDQLAEECKSMYETEHSENIDQLFLLGGSSGGARPKIFYQMDGAEWIVKFPSSMDVKDIGVQEYEYSLCARHCGIDMAETRLLPSDICSGYFAVKRFDREKGVRKHMVSAGGLLETSYRIPNLDYHNLMQLTLYLTRSYEEVEKLYRQMCFNVYAHNRDDHSKNFAFLYEGGWKLSPAYDLTYSNSIRGEHATTVDGNGTNPDTQDILIVAKQIGLDKKKAQRIADDIKEIVYTDLNKYL